jgi:hypothetical protein
LRSKAAVEYQATHRGDRAANQRGIDVQRKFDFLSGSLSQRVDEARALFVAQGARAPHFSPNATGCLIGQAVEFIVDGIERDQASLFDQIGKEVSDHPTSAPLLANALQYFSSLSNRVQRLEEPPLEIRIRGEQSSHVIEFGADRCDLILLTSQREKSARVAASSFGLHG